MLHFPPPYGGAMRVSIYLLFSYSRTLRPMSNLSLGVFLFVLLFISHFVCMLVCLFVCVFTRFFYFYNCIYNALKILPNFESF